MLSPNVKLVPPRRQPRTLHRLRLLDTLHNNIHRKVLFVCAPAGYGKTTLLVDFAEDIDAVVYWYRITPEDNNLAIFYENVLQSFQLHHPEFGNDLALSLEQGLPSPQELAYRLVNQLEETLQDFSIFVLDDYHLVSDEPEIADFIEAFINYLPDHLRILIGSRNVYGIPTALLYVQEQLAIIGEEDLKFRQEEIVEL
ncbi:MAG: AAA family ATPase, partial [Anaerolineales bacterium]